MSKRNPKLYIQDIQRSIDLIQQYTGGMTFDQFDNDQKTLDAVVRNFHIIGEAARALPESVKIQNPSIPWSQISGMRNAMIHEYFGVDTVEIWSTLEHDLPALKKQLKRLKV